MHSVCHCSLPVWRRSFLKKGTPVTYFYPALDPPPKNNNTCKGPWVLHAYQVSSKSIKRFWRRSRKCEKFTPDGRRRRRRTTDGRTDDGRCAMTIAHSSLRLRWAKKGRDLTQSYDKNPYTNRKVKRTKSQHKKATKKFDYTAINYNFLNQSRAQNFVKHRFCIILSRFQTIPLILMTIQSLFSK